MSLYVRVMNSFYTHRKTLRLQTAIGDAAFWVPPRIWAYAAANQPDGCFDQYSAEELALLVAYLGNAQALLQALLQAGFLDSDPLRIHDWMEYNGYHAIFAERAKKAATARWAKNPPTPPSEKTVQDKKRKETSIATSINDERTAESRSTIPNSTVIPAALNTPEFRAAWVMWLEHLKQKRKSPSLHAQDLQLRTLSSGGGVEKAIETIQWSIEHNWQGLFAKGSAEKGKPFVNYKNPTGRCT